MLQNMQNGVQTPILVPLLSSSNPEIPIAQGEMFHALKTVSCPICQATYIPSSRQQAKAQGSPILLETAFLCVCHFCFRCHRPACPQCWNPIHGVCTACGEEGHLPFLSPVPSLEGLVLSPPDPLPGSQTVTMPFTCLSNGTFYAGGQISQDPDTGPAGVSLSSDPILPVPLLVVGTHDISSASTQPSRIEQILEQRSGAVPEKQRTRHQFEQRLDRQPFSECTSTGPHARVIEQHTDRQYISAFCRVPDHQDIPASPPCVDNANRVDWTHDVLPASYIPLPTAALPTTALPIEAHAEPESSPAAKGKEAIDKRTSRKIRQARRRTTSAAPSLAERIENTLITIVSILLVAIVLMIVLATASSGMNTLFFHLLHIDIRSEISYLLQIV